MNPSVPSSPHAQPSHGIELFSLYVYSAGVCFLPHSPQERRGVRKVENSRVAFRRSFRFGMRCRLCKGFVRFRGRECRKKFWPAGAAPQGRRGQDASRPARPRVAYFPASTSCRSQTPDRDLVASFRHAASHGSECALLYSLMHQIHSSLRAAGAAEKGEY